MATFSRAINDRGSPIGEWCKKGIKNPSLQGLQGDVGQTPRSSLHLRGAVGRWWDQALWQSTHWKVSLPVCSPPEASLKV